MHYEWDPEKASRNLRKHGIHFADAISVFADDHALTIQDTGAEEERYVTVGIDAFARILVVVYTWRSEHTIRLISARKATPGERKTVCPGGIMKDEYDFSGGKRGALDPVPAGKTRITIRLDGDILEWFRDRAEASGGGNYQTLINAALREYVEHRREPLEETLRRVLREELRRSA